MHLSIGFMVTRGLNIGLNISAIPPRNPISQHRPGIIASNGSAAKRAEATVLAVASGLAEATPGSTQLPWACRGISGSCNWPCGSTNELSRSCCWVFPPTTPPRLTAKLPVKLPAASFVLRVSDLGSCGLNRGAGLGGSSRLHRDVGTGRWRTASAVPGLSTLVRTDPLLAGSGSPGLLTLVYIAMEESWRDFTGFLGC